MSKMKNVEEERYYRYSLLKDLAYHDDVNGQCNGLIDITVVDTIAPAKVREEVFAEWQLVYRGYEFSNFHCTHCDFRQDVSYPTDIQRYKFCPGCGATMKEWRYEG